jgi:hypothetical protein
MTLIVAAGWSSLVARKAHNLEVPGSNPGPATNSMGHKAPFYSAEALPKFFHFQPVNTISLLVWLSGSYKVSKSSMWRRFLLPHKILVQFTSAWVLMVCVLAADVTVFSSAAASNHYTEKQVSALAERVGRTFWIQEVNGRTPSFLSAPDARAASFHARGGDSFGIIELVGHNAKNPYYKVRFDSGKEGYLRPEVILEELNLTLLTVDPMAHEKRKAAEQAEEEKTRLDWINAQPWPAAAKEAARKGEAVPGMTANEVRKIAGAPSRVVKVAPRGSTPEEHWLYPDGKQLIFQRGLLSRIALSDASSR